MSQVNGRDVTHPTAARLSHLNRALADTCCSGQLFQPLRDSAGCWPAARRLRTRLCVTFNEQLFALYGKSCDNHQLLQDPKAQPQACSHRAAAILASRQVAQRIAICTLLGVSCQQPCSSQMLILWLLGKFIVYELYSFSLSPASCTSPSVQVSNSRVPSTLLAPLPSVPTPIAYFLELCRGRMANQASDTPLLQTTLRS